MVALKKISPPATEIRSSFPAELQSARALMKQALELLDNFSMSAAAASLDMAIHQLDRELAAGQFD